MCQLIKIEILLGYLALTLSIAAVVTETVLLFHFLFPAVILCIASTLVSFFIEVQEYYPLVKEASTCVRVFVLLQR